MSDESASKETDLDKASSGDEGEREFVHPLQKNDPILVDHVDFVTLEFLERANHPIPKNQLLNKQEAFGELTGRSVLVALSHGWFFQMHPDPEGVKIEMIVKEFAPRLRKTYPETEILFFYDFLSVPQWPRTKAENKVFRTVMKHMDSAYVHCDHVLFIETELPRVDETLHTSTIRISDYKWTQFLDTIQVASETNPTNGPQQYDCVVKCDDEFVYNVDELDDFESVHVVSYLNDRSEDLTQ